MKSVAELLQPMKDRLAAATPGPWEVVDFHEGFRRMDPLHGVVNVDPRKPVMLADKQLTVQIEDGELADAEFIASAPTDQAKLIAAIEAVESLAEKWRYKGEFGWGAWQEGQGPDPEGHVLDEVSSELRAALTQALGGDVV